MMIIAKVCARRLAPAALCLWMATSVECFGARSVANDEMVLSQILFGSCIKQDKPMPILNTIVAQKPDLFLFLGDNIYADTSDMAVMQKKYDLLKSDLGFAALVNGFPTMATWDDHDYGVNDGGAEYPQRRAAQKMFVDFWDDAPDSPRRKRAGVYEARIFGPQGKRVQVIMLDTRYFRGPLKKGERRTGGPYYPNPDPSVTLLGDEQWKWLEDQLREPAELRIVGSSIQCISEAAGQETWSNLPLERERFFQLIKTTRANGVVIISGDRHWSELSRIDENMPYPIYDFTSSSLNQIHPRGTPTENRFRAMSKTFHKENFGRIRIDWSQSNPRIQMDILDMEGGVQLGKRLNLSDLGSR